MTKRYSVFLTALFCCFIGGVLLLSLALPKQEFSPLENRYLEKRPTLSLETLKDGSFMSHAEDYVSDHIVGRDLWVALKAWSERLSGKKENNGAYFAQGDALINRVEEPDWAQLEKSVGYVDALVGNLSCPVYFGLIPSAAAIWSERLPAGAPTADERGLIDRMYFATGAETADLYGALEKHRDEALYYRTDHHWTSLGAYYGANALLEAMDLEPLVLEDFTKTTVTEDFYGTIFSSSGVRWVAPDAIDVYVPDDGVKVTSYFTSEPAEGALYVDRFLSVKDKYAYFLGGNQSLCVIETQRADAPKVLLVRDSYADSLAPFLTQRFSEIHLFDLRYNLTSIRDYVAQQDIDAVVVLYSFSNFAQGNNLFALGR